MDNETIEIYMDDAVNEINYGLQIVKSANSKPDDKVDRTFYMFALQH